MDRIHHPHASARRHFRNSRIEIIEVAYRSSLFLLCITRAFEHVTFRAVPLCCHARELFMANLEAALANAWLAQIGCKYVSVAGTPKVAASGLPFSVKIAHADVSQRLFPLDSTLPPPPDDETTASSASPAHSTPGTVGTVEFEARRVFFCDEFEGALKWSCPPPSTSTPCEEPPPFALRFELRALPPAGSSSAHNLHCLCVSGGIPNAKVDRNWVLPAVCLCAITTCVS